MVLTFATCHIFYFGVSAFSSREPVLIAFRPVQESAVVEMLMMLQVQPGVFALDCGLLIVWSFWVNVTFFGWLPFWFLMLLLAVFESELAGRQLWLPFFVFLSHIVLVPRGT